METTITVPLQTVVQADKLVQEYIDKVIDHLVGKISSTNLLEDINRYRHTHCDFMRKPDDYQIKAFVRSHLDINYITKPTVFGLLAK